MTSFKLDRSFALLGAALLVAACGSAAKSPSSPSHGPGVVGAMANDARTDARPDTARGGRLFDKWAAEAKVDFKADAKATAGVADGRGGPAGDGTLPLASGAPLLNDAGHDYRLKNFFGWDLRGKAGVYGPAHMNKATALDLDLLALPGTVAEVADRFERGEGPLPAFGGVLSRADLEALAAFVVAVRDGELPRADAIVTLTSPAAKGYALAPGGDAARGKALYAERCASCHGDDGTAFLIDDGEFSVGSHARQKAYEDWFKLLNGQPGTAMGRQVKGATAEEMAQEIRDLLAALCDRQAFPLGAATGKDVEDGDPRCGAALR